MVKNRRLVGGLYVVLLTFTLLTLIETTFFDKYASVALYVNLSFSFLGILIYGKVAGKELGYFLAMLLYLLVTLAITDGGFGSVLTFIASLFTLFSFSGLHFTDGIKRYLIIIATVAIVALFANSIPYGENYLRVLLSGLNPNTMGMFIMFSFMIVCVCCKFKGAKGKVFLLVLLILSIIGMYNYRSRGTTLALCCFVLLLIVPSKVFTKKRFVGLAVMLIGVGTAIPFIYLNLYNDGYSIELFGKSLYTGREYLWAEMFSLMKNNYSKILFGMGSNAVIWDHALNIHNNFFNFIVNFGVIGFTLYYVLILKYIWKAADGINNATIRKALIMYVCAVLVLGFSETTSLWAVIFPFANFGLIVANGKYLTLKEDADNGPINALGG